MCRDREKARFPRASRASSYWHSFPFLISRSFIFLRERAAERKHTMGFRRVKFHPACDIKESSASGTERSEERRGRGRKEGPLKFIPVFPLYYYTARIINQKKSSLEVLREKRFLYSFVREAAKIAFLLDAFSFWSRKLNLSLRREKCLHVCVRIYVIYICICAYTRAQRDKN